MRRGGRRSSRSRGDIPWLSWGREEVLRILREGPKEEAEGEVEGERFGRRRHGERLGRSGLRGACS